MLGQEPKDGDFVRYVDALQAGKLAEIKAENRHLEMNDLSEAGWSKRVTAYLARGAKRVEPPNPVGAPVSGRRLERRHQLMLLGFACLGVAWCSSSSSPSFWRWRRGSCSPCGFSSAG